MVLTVSNLDCDRSGRPVLRGVGFDLEPGRVLFLRGPNGCGKSTLLRCVCGLLPISGGEIEVAGVRMAREPDACVERMAYAGHLDAIKPQLTVAENLEFWAGLFGTGDAGAALEAFDLRGIADRPAHFCSAGQKRRLGLARLLVARREIWLLDEPTVSLDTDAAALLAGAVRVHCEAGGAALIATHDDLALPHSDVLRLEPVRMATVAPASNPFLEGAGF